MTKANLYNYTNTILFDYLSGHGNMIKSWCGLIFTGSLVAGLESTLWILALIDFFGAENLNSTSLCASLKD